MTEPWEIGADPNAPTQPVLNESWPLRDRRTGQRHARGIPDQPHPIPVDVRLVLEPDGETWLPGHAARWTRTHVYVNSISDSRVRGPGVWVVAADVRRREIP